MEKISYERRVYELVNGRWLSRVISEKSAENKIRQQRVNLPLSAK